jgi:replicative DNA helicase
MNEFAPLEGLSQRLPPSNIPAEQALLGSCLANNKAYELVSGFLRPEHFIDPGHARIFEVIGRRCALGQKADPVTMRQELEKSGALTELGGIDYLASLLGAMVGVINAPDYGRQIVDGWLRRKMIDVGEQIVNMAFLYEGGLDADALLMEAQNQINDISSLGADDGAKTMAQAIAGVIDGMEQALAGTLPPIYSTGFPDVDSLIGGGLRPKQAIFLGGRPGHGKSALALQVALHVVQRYGLPVFFASLEMAAEEMASRAISLLAEVPAWRIELGRVSNEELERIVQAQRTLSALPIVFDDRPRQTFAEVVAGTRRFKRKYGKVGMVVVDHMHIIKLDEKLLNKAGLVYATGDVANMAKELAKCEDCPVLVLAQLSRNKEGAEDKTPTLADLKNSGDIEAAADTVLFTHRAELHLHKAKPTQKPGEDSADYGIRVSAYDLMCQEAAGKATILCAKARKGRTGAVDLLFNGETTSFAAIDPFNKN